MAESASWAWAAARRAAILAATWAVLVEGRPGDVLIGLPIAAAIAALSLRLSPPPAGDDGRPRPLALLGLIPRVGWLMLAGGVDVARRALRRRPDLDPDTLRYPLDPPSLPVATGLGVLLTLMPGSLAADVAADRVLVHVLDRRQPVEAQLRRLEDGLRRALGAETRRAPDAEARRA